MYQINNFTNNDDVKLLDSMGPFTVIEYQKDLSVMPGSAQLAYYCNAMNVRKRQVICDLSKANITLQAGAMQWTVGNVNATTGVKGVGDLFGKALRGSVTGESAIKPEYTGDGTLVLEPTYKHILLLDLADWNGSIVLDDGLFLACDSKLKHKAVMRSNFSSAVAGNEGLFNLGIVGRGEGDAEDGLDVSGAQGQAGLLILLGHRVQGGLGDRDDGGEDHDGQHDDSAEQTGAVGQVEDHPYCRHQHHHADQAVHHRRDARQQVHRRADDGHQPGGGYFG